VEKEDRQRGAYKSCINPSCDYLHTKETDGHGNEEELVREEAGNEGELVREAGNSSA